MTKEYPEKELQHALNVRGFVDGVADEEKTHRVIFVIHGIRDYGDWIVPLTQASQESGYQFTIAPAKYPRHSTFPFVLGLFRERNAQLVSREILKVHYEQPPGAIFDIVAHSNGTKIVAEIIESLDIEFNTVIFLNSICKRDDSAQIASCTSHILNHAAINDPWPTIAEAVRPDLFEQTGKTGFLKAGVNDRFFDTDHTGCLSRNHFETHVLPFIITHRIFNDDGAQPNTSIFNPTYCRRFMIAFIMALLALIALIAF